MNNLLPLQMHRDAGEVMDLTVRQFTLRADTFDESARTVDATLATETPVLVFDMRRWEPILEVLRMDGCVLPDSRQVPLLDTHNRWSLQAVLGSCRNLRTEGGELVGKNHYADTESGRNAGTLVRDGHVTDNSVGYEVLEFVDIEPGTTAEIGGVEYTAPDNRRLRISTKWRVKENSNCPIGADDLAVMRAAAQQNMPQNPLQNPKRTQTQTQQGGIRMNERMRQYLIRHYGLSADATDEEARSFLAALPEGVRSHIDTETKEEENNDNADAGNQRSAAPAVPAVPAAPAADPTEVARQAVQQAIREERQAEQQRISAIRTAGQGLPNEIVQRAIDEGMDVAAAQGAFLEHVRDSRAEITGAPYIQGAAPDAQRQHLEAAMLLRAGSPGREAAATYDEPVLDYADKRLRSLSLVDLTRMALSQGGHDVPLDRKDMIRAGFATGSLSTILGNTAGKMLLVGFRAARSTWRDWCSVGSVTDFKSHPLVRLNDLGELEEIGNDGEVKSGRRSESNETVQAKSFGRNIGITRKDIVNDDLDVFTRIPMLQGRRASQRIDKLVYTILLAENMSDGSTSMFSADLGNLQTGSALAKATVDSALALFRKQTDAANEPIDIEPAVLLVPASLEQTARGLCNSALLIGQGDDASPVAANNTLADYNLKPVAESRLENTNYTGYSATNWYLMGAPADSDNVRVVFLNGNENPTLEQFNAGPDYDGVIYRVLHDFGAAAVEYRGMVKSEA